MSERPLRLAVLGAGIGGIAISAYLTVVHFTSPAVLVCSSGGVVDCERVLTSPYGSIAGTDVPTSAAGLLWFGVSLALLALRRLRLHLAWGAAGLLTVLYLVFIEVDRLRVVCAWCTAAHAMVLITFLSLLMLQSAAGARAPARR